MAQFEFRAATGTPGKGGMPTALPRGLFLWAMLEGTGMSNSSDRRPDPRLSPVEQLAKAEGISSEEARARLADTQMPQRPIGPQWGPKLPTTVEISPFERRQQEQFLQKVDAIDAAAGFRRASPSGEQSEASVASAELPDSDFMDADGIPVTARYLRERLGIPKSRLAEWANKGCPDLNGNKLRRRKIEGKWCYHYGDAQAINFARDRRNNPE